MKLTPGEQAFWQDVRRSIEEATECGVYSHEDMAAFVEGRLKLDAARAIETHLSICPACRDTALALRDLQAEMPEHFPRRSSDDVLDVVWQAPAPVTAAEIRAILTQKGLELPANTITRALRELKGKGLVEVDNAARPRLYQATAPPEVRPAETVADAESETD